MYWYVMHIGMVKKINKTDQMILYVRNNFSFGLFLRFFAADFFVLLVLFGYGYSSLQFFGKEFLVG